MTPLSTPFPTLLQQHTINILLLLSGLGCLLELINLAASLMPVLHVLSDALSEVHKRLLASDRMADGRGKTSCDINGVEVICAGVVCFSLFRAGIVTLIHGRSPLLVRGAKSDFVELIINSLGRHFVLDLNKAQRGSYKRQVRRSSRKDFSR